MGPSAATNSSPSIAPAWERTAAELRDAWRSRYALAWASVGALTISLSALGRGVGPESALSRWNQTVDLVQSSGSRVTDVLGAGGDNLVIADSASLRAATASLGPAGMAENTLQLLSLVVLSAAGAVLGVIVASRD